MNFQNERCKAVVKWHGKTGKFRIVELVFYGETMAGVEAEMNINMKRLKEKEW